MKNAAKKKLTIIGLLIVINAICIASISPVYALFIAKTNEAKNSFKTAIVNVAVMEKGEEHEDYESNVEFYDPITDNVKSVPKVVTIKNKESVAYVRVTLDAALVSETGRIPLSGQDIQYSFQKNTSWMVDENQVYYYTQVLSQNEESEVLLKEVTLNRSIPSGYHLEVKVLSDAISGKKTSNLKEAWDIENFNHLQKLK